MAKEEIQELNLKGTPSILGFCYIYEQSLKKSYNQLLNNKRVGGKND